MSENSLYICPACKSHNNNVFGILPPDEEVQGVCHDCGCVFSTKYCKHRDVPMEVVQE